MCWLQGHTARVLHMAQSPDGSTIVSAAADETLRFWKCFGDAPVAQKVQCPTVSIYFTSMNVTCLHTSSVPPYFPAIRVARGLILIAFGTSCLAVTRLLNSKLALIFWGPVLQKVAVTTSSALRSVNLR